MEEGVDEAEALVEVEGALCKELGPGRPARVETAPLGKNNGGGRSTGKISQISMNPQQAVPTRWRSPSTFAQLHLACPPVSSRFC